MTYKLRFLDVKISFYLYCNSEMGKVDCKMKTLVSPLE